MWLVVYSVLPDSHLLPLSAALNEEGLLLAEVMGTQNVYYTFKTKHIGRERGKA